MSLRQRSYEILEATTSASVPDVIGSQLVRKKVRPSRISGAEDFFDRIQKKRKKKKRLIKKISPMFSPPLPPRV
jgi:SOS response regulatory protein OraA/RecX